MSPEPTPALLASLSDRDRAITESLRQFRLLSTQQLRRLHFADGHANPAAATRATTRVLTRLEDGGVIARLNRRIGGARGGSTSLIWQLGPAGERAVRALAGGKQRRRYVEPSGMFARHTIAVAELAVRLIEASRTGAAELLRLDTEPACWRSFVAPTGAVEWLKPDLYVITASSDFEDHAFVEVDLGTEHVTTVLRKARAYQRYRATGRHEADHGVFPAVTWVVPNGLREGALTAAFGADAALAGDLHRVTTADAALAALGVPGVPGRDDETPEPTEIT